MADYGINDLLDAEGFDTLDEFLEAFALDSCVPSICRICGHTTEMEPDQEQGHCEGCGANEVISGLRLAGMI